MNHPYESSELSDWTVHFEQHSDGWHWTAEHKDGLGAPLGGMKSIAAMSKAGAEEDAALTLERICGGASYEKVDALSLSKRVGKRKEGRSYPEIHIEDGRLATHEA